MKKKALRLISLMVCATILVSSTTVGYAAPITVSENSDVVSTPIDEIDASDIGQADMPDSAEKK